MQDNHAPRGLAGVLVWTSQDGFAAMESFYCDILALSPRSRRPGFVNFDWDGVRLTVAVHSDIDGSSAEPARLMLNFGVEDIAGAHASLRDRGVAFSRPPERESWGWVATFADPDGNVLQLIQPD